MSTCGASCEEAKTTVDVPRARRTKDSTKAVMREKTRNATTPTSMSAGGQFTARGVRLRYSSQYWLVRLLPQTLSQGPPRFSPHGYKGLRVDDQ